MIVGALVVLAIGAIIYLVVIDSPPEVAAERLALDPIRGPEDAEVTVYEFGAYGCSSCRSIHQRGFLDQLFSVIERDEYRNRVNFVFVNFPVIDHSV